jgi:hypothetical protein
MSLLSATPDHLLIRLNLDSCLLTRPLRLPSSSLGRLRKITFAIKSESPRPGPSPGLSSESSGLVEDLNQSLRLTSGSVSERRLSSIKRMEWRPEPKQPEERVSSTS